MDICEIFFIIIYLFCPTISLDEDYIIRLLPQGIPKENQQKNVCFEEIWSQGRRPPTVQAAFGNQVRLISFLSLVWSYHCTR